MWVVLSDKNSSFLSCILSKLFISHNDYVINASTSERVLYFIKKLSHFTNVIMLNLTPTSDVVKVGVQANNRSILFIIDQNVPLEKIIRNICKDCDVSYEKTKFALQLLPEVSHEQDEFKYITDFNRYLIKNGHVLKLVYSPSRLAKMIQDKLGSNNSDDLSWAISKAAICSVDLTFCKEFYPLGYQAIRSMLNELILTKDLFSKSLQIILNLISSNFLKELDDDFLLQLKKIVTSDEHIGEEIVECSISILEAIIMANGESEFVTSLISLDELVHHVWSRDSPMIQGKVLALMNAMVLKGTSIKNQRRFLKVMDSKSLKDNIYMNIILPDRSVPSYLAHAILVYQSLILTLVKDKSRNIVKSESLLSDLVPYLESNSESSEVKNKIDSEFACPIGQSTSSLTAAKENNEENPSLTFSSKHFRSDNGENYDESDSIFDSNTTNKHIKRGKYVSQLTFNCVFYFYNTHREDYQIALADHKNNYTKLLHTSEKIVQILCLKVLNIGNIPERGETTFCPLVFVSSPPFFEELFSRSVNLLHKTKREMRAKTASDLEKVFQVIERQLIEALASQPTSFDRLEASLSTLTYWTVRNQWEEEHLEREKYALANSSAVKHLRTSLVDETKELVKKQRLKFIKNGTTFPAWNAQRNQRVKNKSWYASLLPNEKAIQYDIDGEVKQLPIQNITSLVTGRRCPHVKSTKSRPTNGELAFSLMTEENGEEFSLDFIAPTQEVYDHWTDALNVLLGNEMKSISMKRDMNCLIEMEVRLRLLETDGIELPTQPPPIPLEPLNYNFSHPEDT